MLTNKSITGMFQTFLIIVFLMAGVLPAQAISPANPPHASGDFAWAKRMGGTQSDDGQSITVDSNGNVYTTGMFQLTTDFDPGASIANLTSAGDFDTFVLKLNSGGNFVWAKRMGGVDGDLGYDIDVDASGNVYTTGTFKGVADFDPGAGIANLTSAGESDIFVSKLNSSGNFVWAKRMGGVGVEDGRSIAVDASGNVYTIGYFSNTADFDPGAGAANLTSAGEDDIFISKLNSNGNFVWAKRIGAAEFDYGHGIAVDSSGSVYTTGVFQLPVDFDPGPGIAPMTNAGGFDAFVLKLNSNGNFVWAKRMGGTNSDLGRKIDLDANSNIYTTGYFFGTADFDPGAGVANLTSVGSYDVFISKLNSGGNFVWAKSIGSAGWDYGNDIAVSAIGNVYTTGNFSYTADFDPGPGTTNLTSAGWGDIFVSKLDTNGNFVWAKRLGGTDNDEGINLAVDLNGKVYTTGYFNLTADFDPGPGAANLTSAGWGDIFISKLGNTILTSTLQSLSGQDGWVLESAETSNAGGSMNNAAVAFNLGDNASRKQYLGILSFNTGASLPDNAIITAVTLKVKQQTIVGGGNPVAIFQGFMVDIKNGFFGTAATLQTSDFQATTNQSSGSFNTTLVDGWYSINLTGAKSYINKFSSSSGLTQIRLRFKLDDNNNTIANVLSIYSGNAPAASRPQLVIQYYVP